MKTIFRISLLSWLMMTPTFAQDTTTIDLGKSGNIVIVDKGSANEITIDADSLSNIVGTVAEDVLKSMNEVMTNMFETLAITLQELEEMDIDKKIVEKNVSIESMSEEQRRGLEEMKRELENAKLELEAGKAEIRAAYEEQQNKYEQYRTFSEIYRENEKQLRKANGKVTIEVEEPVLISKKYEVQSPTDTTEVKVIGKSIMKVIEDDNNTEISIGNHGNIRVSEGDDDTVVIQIGKKIMRVIDSEHGPDITFDDAPLIHDDMMMNGHGHEEQKPESFKGHWAFFELGRNLFTTPDYSLYSSDNDFMELNYNKSTEVSINPIQFNVGLLGNETKGTARLGLVTGFGFNWNNYVFDNPVTVAKIDNMLAPIDLLEEGYYNIEKSKLTATYLTVPLLFELQFPGNNKFHISAGGIGALKLASHTKIKFDDQKEKDKGNFYLAPFRYGLTARLGFGGINVYGTYYFSDMFVADKGPIMLPYTIGIGFGN